MCSIDVECIEEAADGCRARSPNGSSWSMSFVDWPYPGMSGTITRKCFARASMFLTWFEVGRSPHHHRATGRLVCRADLRHEQGPPPNRYELGGAGEVTDIRDLSFVSDEIINYLPYGVNQPAPDGAIATHRRHAKPPTQEVVVGSTKLNKGVTMNNQNSQSLLRRRSWRRRLIRVTCAITLSAAMAQAEFLLPQAHAAPTSNPWLGFKAPVKTSADGNRTEHPSEDGRRSPLRLTSDTRRSKRTQGEGQVSRSSDQPRLWQGTGRRHGRLQQIWLHRCHSRRTGDWRPQKANWESSTIGKPRAYNLVEWAGTQPFSTGKVGVEGFSHPERRRQ